MASRSDFNIAELATRPGLVLGWGLVGVVGLVLMWFIWPLVILTGLIGGGYWLWRQQQIEQAKAERQAQRLNHSFYALLQHRQGRVSTLELAMHSRMTGAEAQRYLHAQAQALGAYFERTVHGDTIYIFNLDAMYAGQPTPAEMAWAYAERERMRAHHYQMAQSQMAQSQMAQSAIAAQAQAEQQANPTSAQPRRASLANDQVPTIDVSAANG